MGSKHGDICFWRGEWSALCICHVFGLQMIFETRRTHFMLTVHADNFVLSTKPSGSVLKVNLTFINRFSISFHFRFSVHRVFPEHRPCFLLLLIPILILLPPSAIDRHKSNNARFFFFLNTER